ncbi:membrane integrity-associated transporter subunit PqiC [Endozoicomonas sp. SCSIO W0465]|uniref:PqiC family protein n=1 Tax=Endozoicomonas sp. SCSIO W0465 TaxID=2918516 RepID=UPI002074FF00|nr:ABC-type transport auxiliary lipoprotein family protein [Endozoicomonas sp. SCSIO W0465]USE34746.1 PqiC family protein [Endozoicomonas sp. SCSIO W0465]
MNLVRRQSAAAKQAFCLILLLGLMAGCSVNNSVYHDYTLVAATVSQEQSVLSDLPPTLGVFPVSVAGWLDKKNITWSDGGVRLQSSVNNHWGEPLPELLTQAMIENLRQRVHSGSWVSSGPWVQDKRPEVVAFINVQSIAVVKRQLQMNVAWSLEGPNRQIIVQRNKVYTLSLEHDDSTQNYVQTLSQVWGAVADDMLQAYTKFRQHGRSLEDL